jgi:hypothetical protein
MNDAPKERALITLDPDLFEKEKERSARIHPSSANLG